MIDWLKIDLLLHERPEIGVIAKELDIDRYSAVGRVIEVWAWFEWHTLDRSISEDFAHALFAKVGCKTIEAMRKTGWIISQNNVLCMKESEFQSTQTAKARALALKKQRAQKRVAQNKCPSDSDSDSISFTKEENVAGFALAAKVDDDAKAKLIEWVAYRAEIGKAITRSQTITRILERFPDVVDLTAAVDYSIDGAYQNLVADPMRKKSQNDGSTPRDISGMFFTDETKETNDDTR